MTIEESGMDEPRRSLDELEPALRERLLALDEPVSWDEWSAVVRRSRRMGHRPHVLAALAALAAVALGAGVAVTAVDLSGAFRGRPAAASAQAGVPAAVASALLSDGNRTLYVSPTKQRGGFCYRWAGSGGGCEQLAQKPFWVTWNKNAVAGAVSTSSARLASVKIEFTDGTSAVRHVAWMSAPVNAGFFVYEIPSGKTVEQISSGSRNTGNERSTT
jgi:hypothetical protein